MVQYRNAKDMDIGPTFITRYWHNIIFTLANIGQYYSDISHWEYIVPILVEYQRATWALDACHRPVVYPVPTSARSAMAVSQHTVHASKSILVPT